MTDTTKQQNRYIEGVPCWADLRQPDVDAAKAFYGGLFGWTFDEVAPPGSGERYAIARTEEGTTAAIGGATQGAPATGWHTYVWVDDAAAAVARAREAGGTILAEPMDVGEAGRMATFADPGGAAISVWQAAGNRGAQVVNAHGAVNFNDLHTRDLDAARAFYGAVFGWDALLFGEDNGAWALPAYGEFLEARTPGMRAGMRDMGAPERFEEVVATVTVLRDDRPDHWGITFAVDDADEIARRAYDLGGRIELEPVDAPWTRMAVITDPQGATFTAATFVPENKDVAPPVAVA